MIAVLTIVALGSYLVGAVPFGYLIARRQGINIFEHGSRNIGATNVGRVLGKRFGILVFALDFLKGAIPAGIARGLEAAVAFDGPAHLLETSAGLCAFLGHLFPCYLRFRGGKGVATGAGVVSVLLPVPALIAVTAWGCVLYFTRYVSLASITAVAVLCTVHLILAGQPFAQESLVLTIFCLVAALLVVIRHHANIRRLLKGVEHRV